MGNANNKRSPEQAASLMKKLIRDTRVNMRSLTDFGDEGINILVEHPTDHILQLQLCRNSITGKGVESLTRGKWNNLKTLNLWNNQIANKGCKFLAKSNFKHLHELNLVKNGIQASGMQHLKKAQWKELVSLNLYNNRIGENGVNALVKMEVEVFQFLNLNKNMLMAHEILMFLIAKPTKIKWMQASANKMTQTQAQTFKDLSLGIINKVQINNDNFN